MDTLDSKNENHISDQAVNDLGGAAGWAIAMAVLFFLVSLFILIGALNAMSILPGVGFMYLVLAGGYGFLGYLLIMQGISVNKYRLTKASADFDAFASNYKKFWMTFVCLIIALVLLALIIGQSMGGRGMF
jgi:hypothetical protein